MPEGYCVKCKAKKEIADAVEEVMKALTLEDVSSAQPNRSLDVRRSEHLDGPDHFGDV